MPVLFTRKAMTQDDLGKRLAVRAAVDEAAEDAGLRMSVSAGVEARWRNSSMLSTCPQDSTGLR